MTSSSGRGFLHSAQADAARSGRLRVEIGLTEAGHEVCSGPRLEINLDNVAWNIGQIRSVIGKVPIMAVVKANAYGHGMVAVSRFLEERGVEALTVADADSAILLREKGIRCPILNQGPFSGDEAEAIIQLGISQLVYGSEFGVLAERAARLGKQAKVHVKIDTGLGRLGVPYYQALPFIRRLSATPGLEMEGVLTTFSEEPDFDREQLGRFLEVCGAAGREGIALGLRHAARSAAVLDFPESHLDMVRPGIAVYGCHPTERARRERKVELRSAMTLKAPVLYVKTLRPGDGVSYQRPFRAEKETRVATLGIGYSSGFPPEAAGKGEVLIRGGRFPLIAAVTADHASVDLLGNEDIVPGDEAVLIGAQGEKEITADAVAGHAGISVYRLIIGMSPLLHRRYLLSG
jgi:alanine racemase